MTSRCDVCQCIVAIVMCYVMECEERGAEDKVEWGVSDYGS